MTHFRRCPACGELAEAPGGPSACPTCGAEVPAPAGGARRAKVLAAEPPARPSSAAAWRVGGLFVAALLAALGFTAHVARRVVAPEAVAELPAPPPAAPVAALPPTNLTRPPPRPAARAAAPIELDAPDLPAADATADWRPFEPAGLRMRVSLPGERRRRAVRLAGPGGTPVEATEDAVADGASRYLVLTLPSPDGPLTPATLPKLLASLRPDSLAAPAWEAAGPQEYVAWRFAAHDGTDWDVFAVARAGKLVLLVRSLDRTRGGADAAAGLKRFLDSVELLRED